MITLGRIKRSNATITKLLTDLDEDLKQSSIQPFVDKMSSYNAEVTYQWKKTQMFFAKWVSSCSDEKLAGASSATTPLIAKHYHPCCQNTELDILTGS